MRVRHMAIALVLLAIGLAGCSRLTFYPDPAMKQDEVGLKAYYSKPYILIARDGTAKVTSVSVVYLPDLEHPVYARAISGYGSANLTLAFSNGMITSFGQQTDSKIPETLTALGGLDTAIATARKTRAETVALEKQSGDFGKYAGHLKTIAADLRLLVDMDTAKVLNTNQRTIILFNANVLDGGDTNKPGGLAMLFAAPGAAANADNLIKKLEEVNKALGEIKPASEQLSNDAKKIWEKLAGLQNTLSKILDDLKPKPAEPPALSLYEIIMLNRVTNLREVPLGPSIK